MKTRVSRISALLALLLVMLVPFGAAFADTAEVYHIGIIQLIQHDALDAATQGFMDALTDKLGADKLDFDYQNAQGSPENCATIVNGFVSADVDLIMANATAALQASFAGTETIPILGTSITDYASALELGDFDGTTGYNVSGASDLAPLDEQAALVKELFPEAKCVGLLYCSGEPNSVFQINAMEGYLSDLGITTARYSFTDSNDLASVVTSACEKCDVIYVPTDNTVANNTEIVNNICLPAGVPVVAGEEGICAGCGVATLSISYYDMGYTTGEMAYAILVEGADVATMPISYAPEVTMKYNPTNCAELNITVPDTFVAIEG